MSFKIKMTARPGDKKFAAAVIRRFCAPRLTAPASEWVEENLRLNEPKIKGQFNFDGREYLREIVDSFGPETPDLKDARDYAFSAGTGIGKTISLVAGLSYRIANDPMRALVVKPTSLGPAGARSFVKTRLMPTIKATQLLRMHIPTGDRYDVTIAQIQMNGCVLDFTGSNSVSQLGENRCDVVIQDEQDKYPEQSEDDREASAEILADERTKSVPGARRYKFSTPTLAIKGIWAHFLKGDRRRFYVPCPHCNMSVVLAWSKQFTVFEIKGNEAFVKWDNEARNKDGSWDLAKVARSAHFECPHCQGRIEDSHKAAMNKLGKFVPTAKGYPGHVSWHLPSLYAISADCSIGALAMKFLKAKQSLDGVKGFINSDLAEPDVQQSVSVDKTGVASKQIEVTGEWLKILSADYHAQAPYFYALVRAWNGSDKSHGLECRSFNNWSDLDQFQKKHKVGKDFVIIDAGYKPSEVARECSEIHIATRCELVSGVQDQLPEVSGWTPSKSYGGKRLFRVNRPDGGIVWLPYKFDRYEDPFIGTDLAYTMRIPYLEFLENHFETLLQNIVEKKTGLEFTISEEMGTDEYYKHMASKVLKPWKKNPRDMRWQTIGGRDDHLRLCEVLNLVMACRLELISFDASAVSEKPKPSSVNPA